MAKSGGRPPAQKPDTSRAKPRGTVVGRAIRGIPIVGSVVKGLDQVRGDTTYTGSKPKPKISKGYGQ